MGRRTADTNAKLTDHFTERTISCRLHPTLLQAIRNIHSQRIALSILRWMGCARSRNDPHRVHNFYVRRTLRIFPLYYAILLGVVLVWPVMHWQMSWSWLVWPAYVGNCARFAHPYALDSPLQQLADFQPNGAFRGHHVTLYLGHFWSLCVEEQFYLLWPWVVFQVRDRRKLIRWCWAALLLCLTLRLVGQHLLPAWKQQSELLYRGTPFRLDALILGGLFALILRGPHAETLLRFARRLTPLLFVAVAYVAWMSVSQWLQHRLMIYPGWTFTWGLVVIDLLSGLALLLAIQKGSLIYRLLDRPSLRWVGRLSYGAYVWHDIPITCISALRCISRPRINRCLWSRLVFSEPF